MFTRAVNRFGLLMRQRAAFAEGYFSHRPTSYNNESIPFDFTKENYKEVEKILSYYPEKGKKSAIIPLLTLAQKQNDNFLSLNAMRKVAKIVEVNEMDIYEVSPGPSVGCFVLYNVQSGKGRQVPPANLWDYTLPASWK